jgi:acyl carrier protein
MSDETDDMVRDVVAQHMLVGVSEVALTQSLRDDLDLDPLDLVLIALRLEDIEEVEFPITALEEIETVGDLAAVLRGLERSPRAPWLPPPPRREPIPRRDAWPVTGHRRSGQRIRRHA